MTLPKTTSLALIASALASLTTATPLLARDHPQQGLQWAHNISFGGCDPTQQSTILTAIADAAALSTSAMAALDLSPYANPAAYFFPESYAPNAKQVFQTAVWALQPDPAQNYKGLNDIWLYCTDLEQKCAGTVPGPAPGSSEPLLGYVPDNYNPATGQGSSTSPALFVVCPALLALPRNPAPCSHSAAAGGKSLGWGFLRTFLTLRSVQPGFAKGAGKIIADRRAGVEGSHALAAVKGEGYDLNADNYAELGLWSYLVGVSGKGVGCPADCANIGADAGC